MWKPAYFLTNCSETFSGFSPETRESVSFGLSPAEKSTRFFSSGSAQMPLTAPKSMVRREKRMFFPFWVMS